jgi:hypothetical protein
VYILEGTFPNSPHGWEYVDKAETQGEIDYLLREYKLAFGDGWLWRIHKEENDE